MASGRDLLVAPGLSPQQRNLALRLFAEAGIDLSRTEAITRRNDRHNRRLSYAQQRLWFLDQLQPGSSVYNIATALQVEGQLDLERLRRS